METSLGVTALLVGECGQTWRVKPQAAPQASNRYPAAPLPRIVGLAQWHPFATLRQIWSPSPCTNPGISAV